jgi:predicted nucleotide-binding protein (sugar kinase/HSP70/actin superfamily)
MTMKVGIPCGLFYFKYFPLWQAFFKELGVEMILSGTTNRKILDMGIKACVEEACLPVKVFFGHVMYLKDRVDLIFVPRYTSISKNEYICPKFGGLPDMLKHSIKGLPEIIDVEVNLIRTKTKAIDAAFQTGKYFCKDKGKIRKAFNIAVQTYHQYRKSKLKSISKNIRYNPNSQNKYSDEIINIAVIGHVYTVYDSFLNMGLIAKLELKGIRIITIEMIPEEIINESIKILPKKMYWNYGRKAMGSVIHLTGRKDIEGILYVMSFGCGIDSFICYLAEKRVRHCSQIPFTVITLDEHSGEAGIDTRIEAFVDMIRLKRTNRLSSLNSTNKQERGTVQLW